MGNWISLMKKFDEVGADDNGCKNTTLPRLKRVKT
jgi:hypothetical protein